MEDHEECVETERVEKRMNGEPRTIQSKNEILSDPVELNVDNRNTNNLNGFESANSHEYLEEFAKTELSENSVREVSDVDGECEITRSIDSGLESVVSEENGREIVRPTEDLASVGMTNAAEVDSLLEESANCDTPIMDELRSSVQEPDEAEHRTRCGLLHHNGSESTPEHGPGECPGTEKPEPTSETEKPESTNEPPADDADRDGWLYVLGHDQLKKKVVREGPIKRRPTHGQIVTVRCCGRLDDGTEVDRHDDLRFTLGDGDVISAFDLCVALMDEGEVCEVVAASRFAYGELGRTPDIPPNATLTFGLELVGVEDAPEIETLTIAQRIELANGKRERGNVLYARNEFSRAIDSYSKALKILDDELECHNEDASELQRLVDTRVTCHNNLAAAQLKEEAWDAAIKSCEAVLKVQPENVKALFRKGKCLANKGEVSHAIPILKRALKLEPETKIIHQELARLEKKNKIQSKTEKELYQKMLGTDKQPFIQPKKQSSRRWMWYVGGAAAAVLVSVGLTAFRYSHF